MASLSSVALELLTSRLFEAVASVAVALGSAAALTPGETSTPEETVEAKRSTTKGESAVAEDVSTVRARMEASSNLPVTNNGLSCLMGVRVCGLDRGRLRGVLLRGVLLGLCELPGRCVLPVRGALSDRVAQGAPPVAPLAPVISSKSSLPFAKSEAKEEFEVAEVTDVNEVASSSIISWTASLFMLLLAFVELK